MEITTMELADLLSKAYPNHASLFDKLASRIDDLEHEPAKCINQAYEVLDMRELINELQFEANTQRTRADKAEAEVARLKSLTPDFLGGSGSTEHPDDKLYDHICDGCHGSFRSSHKDAYLCGRCAERTPCGRADYVTNRDMTHEDVDPETGRDLNEPW